MEFWVGGIQIRVNVPDEATLLTEVEQRFASNKGFAIATLNLDHLVKLSTNEAFRLAYARQDLVTADGNPIVWLARAAGHRRVELVPGSDLIQPVLQKAAAHRAQVAFVGSTEASLEAASRILSEKVPGIEIKALVAPPMGFDPTGAEAFHILDGIAAQGIRLVLVALGAPKQEQFAAIGRDRYPDLGFLSIGAGLDFIAGAQRRAPAWARRLALEWLWRMLLSPRRLALRYLDCALVLPAHLMRSLAMRSGPSSKVSPLLCRTSELLESEDSFLHLPAIR